MACPTASESSGCPFLGLGVVARAQAAITTDEAVTNFQPITA